MSPRSRKTVNVKRETSRLAGILAASALVLGASSLLAQHDHAGSAPPPKAAASSAAGQMIEFTSGSEKATGYLALPAGGGTHAAIVVIQEWWGLNDNIKAKADAFAKQGYVALAPDLYRGKVATDPDVAHQLMRGLPEDRAVRDMKGAVAYLRGRPEVGSKRIGAVGWCMGGGYSLSLALAEPKLSGAVIYYGRLVTDDAAIQSLQVPLLGNFGGKDQGIPVDSVREFERKAKAGGKSVDFKVYPESGHGFASMPGGPAYRTDDAKDADARTDAFFQKVLGKG
jgi:carboxymethylenebutenolidase